MAGEFGEVLRRLRTGAGLTQEELAERSGVSVRTIRGLETGKRTNPRMTTVQDLANALPLRPRERAELLGAAVPRDLDGERRAEPDAAPGEEPDAAPGEDRTDSPAVGRTGLSAYVRTDDGAGYRAVGRIPHPTDVRPNDATGYPSAAPPTGPSAAPPTAPTTAPPTAPTTAPSPAPPPAQPSAPPTAPPVLRPGAPTDRSHPPTDPVEQLAALVTARWQREEEQRQVQDPFPLPVRWETAPDAVTDHWANILRLPAQATADPLDLDGELGEIAGTYRRIPSRRLVVLGRSGSGKTILALRFVLDHLRTRSTSEPVPVIFSVGAWDPTTITLRDWLAAQLTRDHPGYAARGRGSESLAGELVESGRILPVLDGFDEIADGLRRPALEALNATTLPLVLTSRPAEYAAAVAETDVLTAAAAIQLTDLTLDDLAAYLPRTTRKPGRADPGANAWDPVLTALREQPEDRPGSPLATVLKTPLMVALARTIYSDTPDHDPASLLDTERFGSPEKLEDHLLDNFIPTVYRHRLHGSSSGGPHHQGFDADRARHWLGYLAHHLSGLRTPDLAWWRLGNGLRRSTRTLVTTVILGLTIGLVDGAISLAVHGRLSGALLDGSVVGLLAGLMFGFVHWLTYTAKGKQATPSAVRLQLRRRPGATVWTAGPRLVIGTLGGAVFGLAYGFVVGMVLTYAVTNDVSIIVRVGLIDGLVYGSVFGVATGLTFCLLGLLETPLDIDSAVNPRSLLTTNRGTVTTQLLVWAPTFGAVVGFGSGAAVDLLQGSLGPLVWTTEAALLLGVISGLGGAIGYALTLTAWGQWLVLTRIWLPLTGRLPWAVVTFLEDAYQRGVLRQAGAVYQFRHARLQQHLARHHRRSALHDDFIAPL